MTDIIECPEREATLLAEHGDALAALHAHAHLFAEDAGEAAVLAYAMSGGDIDALVKMIEIWCGGPPKPGETEAAVRGLLDLAAR